MAPNFSLQSRGLLDNCLTFSAFDSQREGRHRRLKPRGSGARVAFVAMNDAEHVLRAARNATTLQRLNYATLAVAIVVYITLLAIAAFNALPGLGVFSTCVMLAELLVFQIVRTLIDHLALVRERH